MQYFRGILIAGCIFLGLAQAAEASILDWIGTRWFGLGESLFDPNKGGDGFWTEPDGDKQRQQSITPSGLVEPSNAPAAKAPQNTYDAAAVAKEKQREADFKKAADEEQRAYDAREAARQRDEAQAAKAARDAERLDATRAKIDADRKQGEAEFRNGIYRNCLTSHPASACAAANPEAARRLNSSAATSSKPALDQKAKAVPSSPATPIPDKAAPSQGEKSKGAILNPDLSTSISTIRDNSVSKQGAQSTAPANQVAALPVQPRSTVRGFLPPSPLTTVPQPGGVSLSKAAAAKMTLDIDLDAASFTGNGIVLSGRTLKGRFDAALFLTALRAACDDHEPYFSLDPDNGTLWSEQGRTASKLFWERIKADMEATSPRKGNSAVLELKTVSAARDYPAIWNDIESKFPNLRSKLVFKPEWLRETRFGEALYKADVLLKELSSGVSLVQLGRLRASAIEGYMSADSEAAVQQLAGNTQPASSPSWRGSRLWFDIAPSSESGLSLAPPATKAGPKVDPELQSLIAARGMVRPEISARPNPAAIVRHGEVYDFSSIAPRMFVRIHDHTTGKDLAQNDPELDGVARDVSTRFDRYADAYDELKILRDIFRAYIAAVQMAQRDDRLCDAISDMPLLASEKVETRLPEFHRSEMFVTIANATTSRSKTRATSSSTSGGVSISGRELALTAVREGETPITGAVHRLMSESSAGNGSDARRNVAFLIDDLLSPSVKAAYRPLNEGALGRDRYAIENEPAAAALPLVSQNSRVVWTGLLALIALAFAFHVRSRARRSGAGRA